MATRVAALNGQMVLVLIWALGLHRDPTPESIRQRWGVSRATSFRWKTKLCDARALWAMRTGQRTGSLGCVPDVDAVPLEGLFQ